jgi:prepilin-type N-terminal cleavage/methylation domain-containing protein
MRSQRGFTLLELLITLSVTTIGLIGLLSLHLSIARGNDGASRSAEAQQVGATELEALRAMRPTDMMAALTGNPFATPPVVAAPKTAAGRAGMTYRVSRFVDQVGGSGSLWRIRVETSWTDDGAAAGANGGQLDHMLPLEVIRTKEEAL